MINPTRTINRLHFEDLDWRRFENLVYEIEYRENSWKNLDPIGLTGNDGGVDILGKDKNGYTWYIQCKNHKTFTKSDAKTIIEKIVDKHMISRKSILLIAIACCASSDTLMFIDSYSKEKGFLEYHVLTDIQMEAMLYGNYKDLLSKYFGEENKNEERALHSNMMRKEVEKKLLREVEWNHMTRMEIARNPSLWFKYTKVVIRSVDDIDDPYGENASYYKICPYQLTIVGIELLYNPGVDLRIAINTDTQCWRKLGEKENLMDREFEVRVEPMVLLPYYNIIEVLEDGDDYSDYPVLMCKFASDNSPFSRHYFKHRATKADFIEGKPIDNIDYSFLLEYIGNH